MHTVVIHRKKPSTRIWGALLSLALVLGLSLQIGSQAQAAGLALDKVVSAHQTSQSTSVTSPTFTTTQTNELIVAFVSSDGPSSGSQSFSTVTGGNLTWKLAKRTNTQAGTAEIWTAPAAAVLKNVSVKATHSGSYKATITIATFSGAKTAPGATGTGNARSGAPTASLTTTQAGSWVWGVGMDWDAAATRTAGANQTKVDEYADPSTGTYWVQRQTDPSASPAGTSVAINDTAPTTDRWNLSTIEILPATSDTTPPSISTGLAATAASPTQVSLSWTASTDNTAVAGYKVLRNGTQIGTSATTTYSDTSASPSTTYNYTVRAYDAAGNTSADSNTASATTPAPIPDTTPPVITAVTASAADQSSATVTWTTDESATSQISYGLDATYGSTTIADSALVTSHSQKITGLNPLTTYHYQVKSADASGNQSVSADGSFATTAVAIGNPAPGISKGIVEDNNSQINQDAIDMQNAGIKWMRGWLECGDGPATAAMAQNLQAHGVTFLPSYNCPLTVSVADYQTKLTADMNALKPYGVHTWEIGNEMNGGWNSEDNYCNNNATPGNMACAEQAYLQYQKAAFTTVHANDPQGIMIYGGLSNWATNLGPWLTAMKNDQAWQWMDGMGFHPYGGTIANSMSAMDSLKSYMTQNTTWASKPIWVTEVGCWSSGLSSSQQSPCSPKSEAGKAAYITGLMDALKAWNKGTTFEIRTPICWYIMHESGNTAGYGLVQLTTPRTYLPAYTAYKNYTGF